MKGAIFCFLAVLGLLDVAWSLTCDEAIKEIMKEDYEGMDLDHDGDMDIADLLAMVPIFDDNGDGALSFQEYLAGVQRRFPNVEPIARGFFDVLGGNKDPISDFAVMKDFANADADGNGSVSSQECETFWGAIFSRLYKEAKLTPNGCTW